MSPRRKTRAKSRLHDQLGAELYSCIRKRCACTNASACENRRAPMATLDSYTDEDLQRLDVILTLTRDMGVNLAGIEIILNMREKMWKWKSR